MLITILNRTAICHSVAEIQLTSVAPLGAVNNIFNYFLNFNKNNNMKIVMKIKGTSVIKKIIVSLIMMAMKY